MFGRKKNKIQVKSVEEYLKGTEPGNLEAGDRELPVGIVSGDEKTTGRDSKTGPFVIQAVVAVVFLGLLLTALSQISGLRSEVASLRERKAGDAQALKAQVSELSARVEKAYKQLGDMTDRLSVMERGLQAQRSRAEVVAKKPAVPQQKKKGAKPRA